MLFEVASADGEADSYQRRFIGVARQLFGANAPRYH